MKLLLASAATLAFVAAASTPAIAAPSTTEGATAETVTTQLPRTVTPSHYAIEIAPDAEKLTFTGKVSIDVTVQQATNSITLHAADLKLASASLAPAKGKAMTPRIETDADAQTATFTFDAPLKPGAYTLAIDYTGVINTQANGLFALDYTDVDGKPRRGLFTQFEAPDARRMVPSWDEPFYKATFDLKALVPSDQMAVSNMPVTSRQDMGNGKTMVTFGTSPRMSTYLLYFGLGDMERRTAQSGNTEIGVITQRGKLEQAQYGLDAATQILPWLNEYFGTAYPLPKLDHIAGPGQSQFFGAMENWGAIFYFEGVMLLDPRLASPSQKERIFTVFAHEMAHQWFGDLVTMSWWDDLWLNEGFASWLEGRATEHFHPEWKPQLTAVGGRNGAMNIDALSTTHPVIQNVDTVEQAMQAFDAITYQKGEAVIRMLESYTGKDEWREGVRSYIKRYEHANTVTDDLWTEMEKASGKPIVQIAHDFTKQPGIPLVKVSGACKGGQTMLTLEQGEFTRDRPDKQPLSWHVPVQAMTLGGTPSETLLDGKGTMTLAGCGPVIVNAGQSGYYRVQYAPALFQQVAGSFAKIDAADQLGILSDSLALGLAGNASLADSLDLIDSLPASAEPDVLANAASMLSSLYAYADGSPAREASLAKLASAKFLPVLNRLGWEPKAGEPETEATLRASLISMLGDMGEPSVVAEAQKRFAASSANPEAIDPSLRTAILSVVAYNADAATWDRLHTMAQEENSQQLKSYLYSILGATKDEALAQKALDLALTDEPGETVTPSIISYAANEHPDMAYDFALSNYDAVIKRVDLSAASRYFPRLASASFDPAMIGKLQTFAQEKLPEEARRPAEEAIATIRYRSAVRANRMPTIDAWLKKHGY